MVRVRQHRRRGTKGVKAHSRILKKGKVVGRGAVVKIGDNRYVAFKFRGEPGVVFTRNEITTAKKRFRGFGKRL